MCYPKPGPRCSNHARQTLDAKKKKLIKANQASSGVKLNFSKADAAKADARTETAMSEFRQALRDFDSTPDGQEELAEKIAKSRETIDILQPVGEARSNMEDRLHTLEQRQEEGQVRRKVALEQYKATQSPNGKVNSHGTVLYKNESGKLHRDGGPAKVEVNGHEEWYQNGKLHREDGPALKFDEDYQEWYQNDNLHREDGPATIHPDGTQSWWKNGQRNREDGPAIVRPHREGDWYRNGKPHREDGPAVTEGDGTQFYYNNGELHREDGPAIVSPGRAEEWWKHGEFINP